MRGISLSFAAALVACGSLVAAEVQVKPSPTKAPTSPAKAPTSPAASPSPAPASQPSSTLPVYYEP